MENLKEKLEEIYNSFDFDKAIQHDPIKFPKKHNNPLDIEVSAFIASSFAYGSIICFCNFLEEIFEIMGKSPADFVINFQPSWLIEKLKIKYRFSSVHDIVAFLFILQRMLKKGPSLEIYFNHPELTNNSTISKISNFVNEALNIDLTPIYGKNIKTKGLLHFFPKPEKGSPCKRINLFLRWMVRHQDIDFGLWKIIKPSELIIPLDIHVLRVSKKIELTKRNVQNLKTAIEITESLKKLSPSDPLKYDFILCHGDINNLFDKIKNGNQNSLTFI